jgi:hypothetical protein
MPYRHELLKASLSKTEKITEEGMNYGCHALSCCRAHRVMVTSTAVSLAFQTHAVRIRCHH